MTQKNNHANMDVLCPAGKVLEVRLNACTDNLVDACKTLQNTCSQISESIKDLTEYSVRDKERLYSLEKSRDCKTKKMNELQNTMHEHAIELASYLGEHKAGKKIAIGGLASGPIAISLFECIKYLFSKP